MPDQRYHVYVIPARMTALPFIGDEDELITRTRDADGLVISSAPVTRNVLSALEGLKVVARTGVGYDVTRVLTGQRPLNVVNPEVYAPGAVRRAR